MTVTKQLTLQGAKARMERMLIAIDSGDRPEEELEEVLRRRAEILSRPLDADAGAAGEAIVIFRLGAERYAVPLSRVSEVAAHPRVGPVPGAPEEVAGLIQVRGEIRVVWNLRRLLGLPAELPSAPDSTEKQTALLFLTAKGEAAVLVDEVEDIRNVQESERRPAPEGSSRGEWMTHDLVVVLDLEGLLP